MANSDHPNRIDAPSGYHKGVEEIGPRSSGLETEVLDPASAKKPALDPVAEHLMEQIVDEINMEAAWKKVRSNRGAPGPDGITIDEFQETFRDVWSTLRQQLLEGTYRPSPARRKSIPKPDGSERHLGIANVIDRLIEQAVLQILTPIFDPDFSESSFGFRPGRSAHEATHLVQTHIRAGYGLVRLPVSSARESIPESLADRSTWIPNGPDPARVRPTRGRDRTRANMGVSRDDILLVVASRMSREKRIGTLMQAVEHLGPGWQLRIAGSASESESQHAKQLHALQTDRVKIIVPVSRPGDLLAAADGYLANSEYEGYGLSVSEAMLASVPVLSTKVGLLESSPNLAAIIDRDATVNDWAVAIASDFATTADQQQRVVVAQAMLGSTHSIDHCAAQWQSLIDHIASRV
ncbi:glycosyltransferase [Planctomycetaceae bacterium SH139]